MKTHQITGTGTIKEGKRSDREVLTLPFFLGPFEIVVIASVPDEGTYRFPFYVKFGMRTDWTNDRPINTPHHNVNHHPNASETVGSPIADAE